MFFSSSTRPDCILDEIRKTKTSTHLTNDFFPCSLLKLTPNLFADSLSYLFYSIAEPPSFPAIWKVAYGRPLDKKLSKTNIESYRPISLLPIVSLIFERLLFNYLYELSKHQIHPKTVRLSVA